ncbi:MAG: creatininase family protein [Wenzhouxiangella sp.]|jgi:creatinine amidohydrolase|nr:creatininase family protein [Wenzhouxiangella sp.]
MIHYWQHLTSPELSERAGPDALAVMVLGAIEQHGPHLPLSTDLDIATGLMERALAALDDGPDVLVLPALALGASDEHAGFAGTLSLSAGQMSRQLERLGAAVAGVGIRRLILVNGHGGNIGWLGASALTLRRRYEMLVVKASYMAFQAPTHLLGADELRLGLHGGQAETAMMMHLHPERVRTAQLENFTSCAGGSEPDAALGPEAEAAWAWLAEDLNGRGVVGNAARADAALGEKLVEFYAARLTQVLREAATTRLSCWSD